MTHYTFVSDAAGRPPPGSKDKTGVSSIGIDNNIIWLGIQIFWAPQFTWAVQSNTAVYEMIGLLLPIVILHRRLQNRQIVLMVDNEAIIWSWEKKQMKEDLLASILIRALHILEAYLSCKIHVIHLPRISNNAAKIADNLSRKSTTRKSDLSFITHNAGHICRPLSEWLERPHPDWHLGTKIVKSLDRT